MSEKSSIYSKHIFLFPFRWDSLGKNQCVKKTALKDRILVRSFENALNTKKWKRNLNEEGKLNAYISDFQDYNEYTYFYDFVRDALYDEKQNTEEIIRHYSFEFKNGSYEISTRTSEKSDNKTYSLTLKKLLLHVFANGVGLLSFHLENTTHKYSADILKINDYGRRIYPQFLSDPNNAKETYTDDVKNSFLADYINIKVDNVNFCDNFRDYDLTCDSFDAIAEAPVRIPKFILKLLGGKNNKTFTFSEQESKHRIVSIKPLLDDRMFTLCWYGNDHQIRELTSHTLNKDNISYEYGYHTSDFWYKYVFVDGKDLTCQNKNMLRKENLKHTYERHTDWGTLWGISRYSFVALTNSNGGFVANQISSMYYQMVVLCLMQRASVLKYSNEVARVSSNLDKNLKEIEAINKSYLKFINKMYFREVSPFDQGIEMYDILLENMRIEREVKDLNRELDELYQFARLKHEQEESKKITNITILGAIFLVPSLLASFWGMNVLPQYPNIPDPYFDGIQYRPFIHVLYFILLLTVTCFFIFNEVFSLIPKLKIFKRRKK